MDFSRTLTAQDNFYFYYFHLALREGIDATRPSRLAARNHVDSDIQLDFYEEKERLVKGFLNFFVQRALQCGNCRTILLTLN
jgi:hypothetical protein